MAWRGHSTAHGLAARGIKTVPKRVKIRRSIKFVGHYRRDGTILIDNDVHPRYHEALKRHERTELSLMQKYGMSYAKAHNIATKIEKDIFRKKFGSRWREKWRNYTAHVNRIYRKENG